MNSRDSALLREFIDESFGEIDERFDPSTRVGERGQQRKWSFGKMLPGFRGLFGERPAEGWKGLFMGRSVTDLGSSMFGRRGLFPLGRLFDRAAGSSSRGRQLSAAAQDYFEQGAEGGDVGDLFARTGSVATNRLREVRSKMLESLMFDEEIEDAEEALEAEMIRAEIETQEEPRETDTIDSDLVTEFQGDEITSAYIDDLKDIIAVSRRSKMIDVSKKLELIGRMMGAGPLPAHISDLLYKMQTSDLEDDTAALLEFESSISNVVLPNLFSQVINTADDYFTSRYPDLPFSNLSQDALDKL